MSNPVRYLRVSLIDQCNLACSYCKPSGHHTTNRRQTDREKFAFAIQTLYTIGVRKVRFTGGEPTVYRELTELIKDTSLLSPVIEIAMTSNGVLLRKLAPLLAKAGLGSVNISLDTLNRDKFKQITRVDALHKVIDGIYASKESIQKVKLNCVVMKGVNDDEFERMIRFADKVGIDIRFIEFMPTKHNSNHDSRFISGGTLRASLPFALTLDKTPKSSAARYYRSEELKIRVGFIDPVSHSFCGSCDRLRLASDGNLYGCLFSGSSFNLFDSLNMGVESAIEEVHKLVANKEFIGCQAVGKGRDDLPSFISIGG